LGLRSVNTVGCSQTWQFRSQKLPNVLNNVLLHPRLQKSRSFYS
jgi:hypothetical protein